MFPGMVYERDIRKVSVSKMWAEVGRGVDNNVTPLSNLTDSTIASKTPSRSHQII